MSSQATQPEPPPQRVYVIFTAMINPHTVETLTQALSNIAIQGVPEVYLVLSTPGGDVRSGLTLYNFLKGVPFELIVHNTGNVDSIGNAVFLAGNKRVACQNATFMFHGVGFDQQAGRYEEKQLREMLENIMSDQRRIGDIIAEHTDLTQDEIQDLFRETQTKTAEFARQRGIVHSISEFHLPARVPVISLVFPG